MIKPNYEPQCELMRGAHNLIIYPNAAYVRAFDPLSCTNTRVRACACEGIEGVLPQRGPAPLLLMPEQ